jgi:hypothetical protein
MRMLHISTHIFAVWYIYINILWIQFLLSVYRIRDYYDYHYL